MFKYMFICVGVKVYTCINIFGDISDLHHQHYAYMSCKNNDVRLAILSKLCFYGGGAGRKNNSLLFALFL